MLTLRFIFHMYVHFAGPVFHPVNTLAFLRPGNGDMRHGHLRSSAMPVIHAPAPTPGSQNVIGMYAKAKQLKQYLP